jgi:hypothetical protein
MSGHKQQLLVKHAFDDMQRFTKEQREAIEKLWGSIKEQQIRRRQGKSMTEKWDVNDFTPEVCPPKD